MFTGIIETLGEITNLVKEQENLHLTIKSTITSELKIDQSIAPVSYTHLTLPTTPYV